MSDDLTPAQEENWEFDLPLRDAMRLARLIFEREPDNEERLWSDVPTIHRWLRACDAASIHAEFMEVSDVS